MRDRGFHLKQKCRVVGVLTLLAAKAGGFLGRRGTTLTLAKGPARPYENDAAALDYFSASSFQVLRFGLPLAT